MKLLISTCPPDRSESLAEEVVRRGLAACVNVIGPVRSIFIWEGKLEREEESILFFKTASERAEELEEAIRSLHPYSVPEIITLCIDRANPDYYNWVKGAVGG